MSRTLIETLGEATGHDSYALVTREPDGDDFGGWVNIRVKFADGTEVYTGAWLWDGIGGEIPGNLYLNASPEYLVKPYGVREDECGVTLSEQAAAQAATCGLDSDEAAEAVYDAAWSLIDEDEIVDAWAESVRSWVTGRTSGADLAELLRVAAALG